MLQFLFDAIGRRIDASRPDSFLTTVFPPPCKWNPNALEDQTGCVAFVTGANQGIGYEVVKLLLQHNATVFLGARDPEKGRAAIKQIQEQTGKTAELLVIDLADLASVNQAVKELESHTSRLDYLFLNAGLHSPPMDELTTQGYDLQQGIVMGHAYLSLLALPLQKSTYEKTSVKPRVVSIASNGHSLVPGEPFDEELTRPSEARTKAGPLNLYYYSKMAHVLLANWLQRLHGDILIANSVHPGGLKTNLFREMPRAARAVISFTLLKDAFMGAWTPVYVACTSAGDKGGQYFIAWCRERTGNADPRAWEEKWQDAYMAWVQKCIRDFESA